MKLDAIGIVAKDLRKSVVFYRMLGLGFPDAPGSEDHVEAMTDAGMRVMLDSEALMAKLQPGWTRPATQSMALAFLCSSPADVDARYEAILAAGFEGAAPPWDAFWGQRYAQVLDPDGHRVDLFAPLP
jgi:uncharacterized glyoxalase superfamily protein PhnB